MAATTVNVPITLLSGAHTVEIVLESGYSLRIIGSVAAESVAVTYPANTTWQADLAGLSLGQHDLVVSDGVDSIPLSVSVGLGPRRIRASVTGSAVYATVVPGLDLLGVAALAAAGDISRAGERKVPAATVIATAGPSKASTAVSGLYPASSTTSGGDITWLAAFGHRLRAVAGGLPAYASLVPGLGAEQATATAVAAGLSSSAVRSLPYALATSFTTGISGAATTCPAVSVAATAGTLRSTAAVGVPYAASPMPTTGIGILGSLPAASVNSSVASISQSAALGIPSATVNSSPGPLGVGVIRTAPFASVTASAGALGSTATLDAPAAQVTTSAASAGAVVVLGGLLYGAATAYAGDVSITAAAALSSATATAVAGLIRNRPTAADNGLVPDGVLIAARPTQFVTARRTAQSVTAYRYSSIIARRDV